MTGSNKLYFINQNLPTNRGSSCRFQSFRLFLRTFVQWKAVNHSSIFRVYPGASTSPDKNKVNDLHNLPLPNHNPTLMSIDDLTKSDRSL